MGREPKRRRGGFDPVGLAGVQAGQKRIKIELRMGVAGNDEMEKFFNRFEEKLRRKVTRKAVNAAARPVAKRVRSLVPKRTGLLRRSITHVVRSYRRGGIIVAAIGQRGGRSGSTKALAAAQGRARMSRSRTGGISGQGKIVPLHLVDQPVKSHVIRATVGRTMAGGVLVFRRYNRLNWERKVEHPGHGGARFMERSFDGSRMLALRAFELKFQNEIIAEANKLSWTEKQPASAAAQRQMLKG